MQWRLAPLALTIPLVLACSKPDALPDKQAQFCKAASESLAHYEAVDKKPDYLDKKADLKRVFDGRTKLFTDILGDGQINGWRGTVKSILATDKGAYLTVSLPCEVELAPTDAQLVKSDSPIYQQLRQLQEGGPVTISGNLERQTGTTAKTFGYRFGYREGSITDGGAMQRPEFVLTISKVEP